MIFANPSNGRINFLLCCFLNSHFLNNPFLLKVQGVLGLQGIHCLWKCVSVCAGGVQLVLLLGSRTVKTSHNKSHWRLGDRTLLVSPLCGTACIVSLHHSIKNNNLDLIGLDLIHAVREGKVLPWGALVLVPLLWSCGGMKTRSGSRHTRVAVLYLGCVLGSAQPWVSWVQGSWRWLGLLCTLCALRVLRGQPAVLGWVCRSCRQDHTAPMWSITWGCSWRKPWDQGSAKFIHRLGLYMLPSDCNGGDRPKVAFLAAVVLL